MIFCVFIAVFLSYASSQGSAGYELVLDGTWQLQNSNGSVSLKAQVPGCVHTALQHCKVIEVMMHLLFYHLSDHVHALFLTIASTLKLH